MQGTQILGRICCRTHHKPAHCIQHSNWPCIQSLHDKPSGHICGQQSHLHKGGNHGSSGQQISNIDGIGNVECAFSTWFTNNCAHHRSLYPQEKEVKKYPLWKKRPANNLKKNKQRLIRRKFPRNKEQDKKTVINANYNWCVHHNYWTNHSSA